MDKIASSVRNELFAGLKEFYYACNNTAKNENCLCLDEDKEPPCHCEKVKNIRQQIRWLDQSIKKKRFS
jgi:hypothetical protein